MSNFVRVLVWHPCAMASQVDVCAAPGPVNWRIKCSSALQHISIIVKTVEEPKSCRLPGNSTTSFVPADTWQPGMCSPVICEVASADQADRIATVSEGGSCWSPYCQAKGNVHKLSEQSYSIYKLSMTGLFWSVAHHFKEMFITLSNHPRNPCKFCLWIGDNTFSGLEEMAANFLHSHCNWTQLLFPCLLLWGSEVNLGMLLCTRKWMFQLHKRWGICWIAEQQSTLVTM